MKNWLVKVACFWSADHIEPIHIRANTERKAETLAIKQLFPNIGDMIQIVEVKEIEDRN